MKITSPFSMNEALAIAEQLGIKWDKVDFSPESFRAGLHVELEHGKRDQQTNITQSDPFLTGRIAWAHLKESPTYYEDLKKIEATVKRNTMKKIIEKLATLASDPALNSRTSQEIDHLADKLVTAAEKGWREKVIDWATKGDKRMMGESSDPAAAAAARGHEGLAKGLTLSTGGTVKTKQEIFDKLKSGASVVSVVSDISAALSGAGKGGLVARIKTAPFGDQFDVALAAAVEARLID